MNKLAFTVNFFSKFPLPKILTPHNSFFTKPTSLRSSGVTVVLSSNLLRSDTFTRLYLVVNLALLNPLLGILLYNGFCPPSNQGLILAPERAF